jgi:predicted Fe-Mo cluster-binding NifX family protein
MLVAVSSAGFSLDAWTGVPFGVCSQFLVVDTETNELMVVSVPPEYQDPTKLSLFAIRAVAMQGAQIVITGAVKDICKQTMQSLGMEVIDNVGRMSVGEAIQRYARGGEAAIREHRPSLELIAVASQGTGLDAPIHGPGEPCTAFVLVDPQTMHVVTVSIPSAESGIELSVNAVRAAARAGATAVITPEIRPACCTALRALAVRVVMAGSAATVREAISRYLEGELEEAPYA